MTFASKRSADEIVHEAQTRPSGDQLQFLREACLGDDALYKSALAELQSRQHWFDGEIESDTDTPQRDIAGELIGSYRVVRSLGQGGMGEVFLAERADEQFRQQVAIKVVRRGLVSRHVQSRLRQERQILASLEHPNIARLYDGGATADGTPYIVMEYVDGEPIDTYSDRHSLTIEQRLRLFMTVCSAVHRAHQSLIVHRDLKPSNILVTPSGEPKLLDFGIAKLLDDRVTMHTLAVTQADVRVMTPDHASPEQIRGDPITTASDIYVLGVLLYELLSGYKPFVLRGNRLAELERAICEDTPLAPSDAVATAARSNSSAVSEIATQRASSPARLRRDLSGDLDHIVLMAMRHEPERRYGSAEQLASDIDNHLRGLPVTAHADAWTYRAGKFVRRYLAVVTLATLVITLLIAFSITVFVQSTHIARERDVATSERTRAENERERAEAVSTFLIDSFRLADPAQARGDAITAREILDRGAARITSELRRQPDLQATLLDTIGNVYLGLNLPDRAQPLIEEGLAIRQRYSRSDALSVAKSLGSLNQVYEQKGDLKAAERLARENLAMTTRLTGSDSVEVATSLCRLGVIEQANGNLRSAESFFNECLKIRVSRLGDQHDQVTVPLANLARLAQDRGEFSIAQKLLTEALAIDKRTQGEAHPRYIRHLFHLAAVMDDSGNTLQSERMYSQALDLARRVFGSEHPETIDGLSAYASLLMDMNRLNEAQSVLSEVLESNTLLRGPGHPYVGNDLENLGRLAFKQRQYAVAEERLTKALEIYHLKLPPEHGMIAAASTMLARTQLELGKFKQAEMLLQQALPIWRANYGDQSVGYAMARAALGHAWTLDRRYKEAEAALIESYPVIAASSLGAGREAESSVRQWIEFLYEQTGEPQKVREYFDRVDRLAKP